MCLASWAASSSNNSLRISVAENDKGLFVIHARCPSQVSKGSLLRDLFRGTQDDRAANIPNVASHRALGKRAQKGLILASMLWPERAHVTFLHSSLPRTTPVASQNIRGSSTQGKKNRKCLVSCTWENHSELSRPMEGDRC